MINNTKKIKQLKKKKNLVHLMFDFKTFNSPAALKDNICFYTLDLSWLTCNFASNKQIDKSKKVSVFTTATYSYLHSVYHSLTWLHYHAAIMLFCRLITSDENSEDYGAKINNHQCYNLHTKHFYPHSNFSRFMSFKLATAETLAAEF